MALILILDDEEPIRLLLRSILEADGHEVLEAPDGRAGLALYRQAPTDLVITDILMPHRDGLEVTIELTREFLDAKVIAMTGASEHQNILNVAKLFGARHLLHKPFGVQDVRHAVNHTLAH